MSKLGMAVIGMGWAGTRQVQAVNELGRKVRWNVLLTAKLTF